MGHRLHAVGFFALCIPVPDLRCRHRYWGRVRRRIARGRWLFRAFDLGGQARLIVSIFYELGGRIGSRLLDGFDLAIGGVGVLDLRVECFGLERRSDQGRNAR